MTGVPRLDALTLLPWRELIAPQGLASRASRWCGACFAEDREKGQTPYFRLNWDVGAVHVCQHHRTPLVNQCPHCGKTSVRHSTAYVMPGWCTACGMSLAGSTAPAGEVTPEQLWVARQIDLLLSHPPLDGHISAETFKQTLHEIVMRQSAGRYASFARQIGVSKSTMHKWLNSDGVPTLDGHLRLCLHTGLTLPDLLRGNLKHWKLPVEPVQHALAFKLPGTDSERRKSRNIDWEAVQKQLQMFIRSPEPISVVEAARRLELDKRQLYLRVNKEARVLGQQWKNYRKRLGQQSNSLARPHVHAACIELLEQGKCITLKEVVSRMPKGLPGVRSMMSLIQEAKEQIGV